MLKLSLIIPVYNEERHIGACLDAIAKQTVMPLEVIVVDNNCSDRTVEIAKSYKFVRVVTETRQGRGYARTAGFNAAKGDILGRIDGDSQISSNWTEKVVEYFEVDNGLAGLTGLTLTPILPIVTWPKSTFVARSYYWNVHGIFGTITTWGANMAIRKSSWDRVSDKVNLNDHQVHEDQDVALWIAGYGQKIIQANDVLVTAYNQSFRYLPKLLFYIQLRNRTKKYHKIQGNLPAPENVKISLANRIGAHLLSIPALIYGLIFGVIFFPLDLFMVRIVKHKNWFN